MNKKIKVIDLIDKKYHNLELPKHIRINKLEYFYRELAFEKRLKREKRKPDEFNQGRFYVCENIKAIITNKVEEDK